MNISIYTLSQYASGELKDTYEPEEIRSICRLIFMDVFHYTNIDIHIQKHENLPESFLGKFPGNHSPLKTGRTDPIYHRHNRICRSDIYSQSLNPYPPTGNRRTGFVDQIPGCTFITHIGHRNRQRLYCNNSRTSIA